jgi:branched-chain amino acid transport system substrate-binding protein
MKKTLLALLLLGFSAQLLAADSIKLAITGPFTGASAPMGASMRDGAKLAVNEINADGGITVGEKKLRIEVIERDDEANPDKGILIAQELASMDGLSGVIGSGNTGVAFAGDKYLQEKGITKIITPATGTPLLEQWADKADKPGSKELSIFQFSAYDGIQSAMVVEEAINRHFTKVALLHDMTKYGVSARDDTLAQIKAQGNKLEVVATENFNIGDKDMTAQLLKAKSAGAQALLVWGIGVELAAVANGMEKVGLKVPLIGGWTLSWSSFIDNAGKNGEGALMPQTFIEEAITPKARRFIRGYHKAYNQDRIPSPASAAQGYDSVLLFAAAVRQAQSTDTLEIRLALEDLQEPVKGVIAVWKHPFSKWNPADVLTHKAFRREHVVMGMIKDGHVVFGNDSDRKRLIKQEKWPRLR